MKKTILIACFMLLLLPSMALAYSVKTGDSVYVSKDETIEGNLYATGTNLNIEGRVTGDVICAGQSINISGQIDGDVICAGQTISIGGQIGGNLRTAGSYIIINGQISRNVMAFGATVSSTASSSVGWDMLAGGGFLNQAGKIGGELYGGGGQATIAGQIGKNVKLTLNGKNKDASAPLVIAPTAKINGNLEYTSEKNANIENGASIAGEQIHKPFKKPVKKNHENNLAWWWGKLIGIFSALVIGLVLISFWREQILKITDLMLAKTAPAMGWGTLILLLTLPAAFILLITIIGAPLSLILIALWLIAIYLSKVLVGILVGRKLLISLWHKKKDSLILAMIIGITISYLIFSIPVIGWFLSLLAVLWGLGGILLALKK